MLVPVVHGADQYCFSSAVSHEDVGKLHAGVSRGRLALAALSTVLSALAVPSCYLVPPTGRVLWWLRVCVVWWCAVVSPTAGHVLGNCQVISISTTDSFRYQTISLCECPSEL